MILEEVGQDPPFATKNMEEKTLGLAVCFSFKVPRPNSNLVGGLLLHNTKQFSNTSRESENSIQF